HALPFELLPRLGLGVALVEPLPLHQAPERLAWERELVDRRPQRTHHRPGRLAAVARVELALELVERGEAVALDLVAEDVDEPAEPVDRAQVRPHLSREQDSRNREVLA